MHVRSGREKEAGSRNESHAKQHEYTPTPPVHSQPTRKHAHDVPVEVTRQQMTLKGFTPVEITRALLWMIKKEKCLIEHALT